MSNFIEADSREPFGVFEFFENNMASTIKQKQPKAPKRKTATFADFMSALDELHFAQTGNIGNLANQGK